jgi:16S rRNA (uracil1498-N3)-methyltransferase
MVERSSKRAGIEVMNSVPGGESGPHAFVVDLDVPVLDDEDRHHLARVLRVRNGDRLTVSDGAGRWRPCRFGASLELTGPIVTIARPEPLLTVGFALVKGERPELIVQKLTELGIDRIVPFVADRSVVRWDDARAAKHLERLRRVGREACMQCRRCYLPTVDQVKSFDEVIRSSDRVAFPITVAERGGGPPSLMYPNILIGPEGGWSPRERSQFVYAVGLSEHVLRSETAALTAGAILAALRSGLIESALNPARDS